MKICSKQAGLVVKSTFPKFKYRFPEADKPIEVDEKDVEKLLMNPTFYESKKTSTKTSTNKNLNSSKATK